MNLISAQIKLENAEKELAKLKEEEQRSSNADCEARDRNEKYAEDKNKGCQSYDSLFLLDSVFLDSCCFI